MSWGRWLRLAAAVVAVPLAIALAVLAVDVARASARLADDDLRFDAAPRRSSRLWEHLDFLPGKPALRLLDLDDDLVYRRTMRNYLRVQPRNTQTQLFGPEAENLVAAVQVAITSGSAEDANPKRRAQYLNLLAVTMLSRYGLGADQAEADTILRRAIGTLRNAVDTDPQNAEAKLNLELALRNAKATNVPGIDPSGGAAEGSISGQGRTGSGY
jgi:hypothetical protein